MAKIVENTKGRRSIRLNVDDIISIVREYQNIIQSETAYIKIRRKLLQTEFYLPEEI